MKQTTASRLRLVLSLWILAAVAVGVVRLWDLEGAGSEGSTVAGGRVDDRAGDRVGGGDGHTGAGTEDDIGGGGQGAGTTTGGGGEGAGPAPDGRAGPGGAGGSPPTGGTAGGAAGPAPDGSGPLVTLPPSQRPPTLAGQVLYISNRGSAAVPAGATPRSRGYNLWTMAPDGSGQRPLTTTGRDAAPALSPDGRRVAWVVADRELWVMDANGSDATVLASCPTECSSPSWSPDGRRLAFRSHDGAKGDVVLVGIDGSGRTAMGLVFDVSGVDWAPDGRRLAVSATGAEPLRGLWVVEIDGSQKRQIVASMVHGPSWSPDGGRILFSDGTDLFTIAPSGGESRALLTGSGLRLRGAWSPDGATIVYDHHPGQGDLDAIQVWSARADGRGAHQLTAGPGASYQSGF